MAQTKLPTAATPASTTVAGGTIRVEADMVIAASAAGTGSASRMGANSKSGSRATPITRATDPTDTPGFQARTMIAATAMATSNDAT